MPAKNQKEYQKLWYQNKKESGLLNVAEKSRLARQKKRDWYNTIMEDKFCVKCGENDVACLDWHHTDPSQKEAAVSYLLCNNSKETILEEIKKCICLCSNCHRKLHYYNRD